MSLIAKVHGTSSHWTKVIAVGAGGQGEGGRLGVVHVHLGEKALHVLQVSQPTAPLLPKPRAPPQFQGCVPGVRSSRAGLCGVGQPLLLRDGAETGWPWASFRLGTSPEAHEQLSPPYFWSSGRCPEAA